MRPRDSKPAPTGPIARLLRGARGDAAVEYLFLVGTIALPAIAAFLAVGGTIVDAYTTMQNILVLPLP